VHQFGHPPATLHRFCSLLFTSDRGKYIASDPAAIRGLLSHYAVIAWRPPSAPTADKGMAVATEIAEEIRAKIKAATGLNASAGISYNKFLAKMASDLNKPNGQAVITPKNGPAFVAALPVKKFHGVGPATAEKMQRLGIETGADLREKSLDFLQQNFGKSGPYFYGIARGIDNRQVKSDRIRKSIGAEDTFRKDIHLLGEAVDRIEPLVGKVWGYCDANDIRGRTITVKIKYADFRQVTRSRSISSPLASEEELMDICQNILTAEFPIKKGVRLLGVTLSSLEKANSATQEQFDLGL
jgi:DNA polymerase-4